jgi:hypothetical protein
MTSSPIFAHLGACMHCMHSEARETDQKRALTGADGRLVKSAAEEKSSEGLVRLVEGCKAHRSASISFVPLCQCPPSLCGLTFGTGEH